MLSAIFITAGHIDSCTSSCQFQGSLFTNTSVGAGNNHYLARFIGLLGKLSTLAVLPEKGICPMKYCVAIIMDNLDLPDEMCGNANYSMPYHKWTEQNIN